MLVAIALAVFAVPAGLAAKKREAVENKRDFVQRVIACRHRPGEPPRYTWQECERKVQDAK